MKIFFQPRFKKEFKKLPGKISALAGRKIKAFQQDPFSPQLKTHKLHGEMEDFWSFSINQKYRIIWGFQDENIIFYSIGTHDIY